MSKDNFSSQSDQYAKYRPGYPAAFFEYLNTILTGTQNAWDCGTGNGQVATVLAKMFDTVYATDISQSQLDNAARADNIIYSVQPAEQTDFPDHHFDLVIVAQAIHWFDFEKFYAEVKRTCKENALLIVIGYGILHVSPEIDAVIGRFYKNVIGPYWDKERRYIDEQYQTIPFPFKEIQMPRFSNTYAWTMEHLIGYLNTWSAVKHFTKQNGTNAVDDLRKEIAAVWMQDEIEVSFPLLLRVGRV
jgi:ubiquinone/menaquinone biosynthesis C-methylase UbiE